MITLSTFRLRGRLVALQVLHFPLFYIWQIYTCFIFVFKEANSVLHEPFEPEVKRLQQIPVCQNQTGHDYLLKQVETQEISLISCSEIWDPKNQI